ncbi:uncharacterized protein SPPG_08794 [Spizellomyces punctatus DAOM BR117]|uniref:Stage III sporulation protein AA AAA+ ATPase domain-containing protein n=1 Tax=Spizellomyces punctatus (strain DAOM BR117) TaxID=645134 RepID=A0A0L0H4F1_SPIPD|nr:uncharacterized protein SPPG_08794 [Spizellomyces punctatus DAOM BR117]KNC95801.1 hypothetical protein SPPG_08794 [Spizellomyces punctatus DAOM BR117]|eukprot:XP_016603841.1 hypothetical protein SPPG_08794 [Spizellomyces punctatus DAOM BR117]
MRTPAQQEEDEALAWVHTRVRTMCARNQEWNISDLVNVLRRENDALTAAFSRIGKNWSTILDRHFPNEFDFRTAEGRTYLRLRPGGGGTPSDDGGSAAVGKEVATDVGKEVAINVARLALVSPMSNRANVTKINSKQLYDEMRAITEEAPYVVVHDWGSAFLVGVPGGRTFVAVPSLHASNMKEIRDHQRNLFDKGKMVISWHSSASPPGTEECTVWNFYRGLVQLQKPLKNKLLIPINESSYEEFRDVFAATFSIPNVSVPELGANTEQWLTSAGNEAMALIDSCILLGQLKIMIELRLSEGKETVGKVPKLPIVAAYDEDAYDIDLLTSFDKAWKAIHRFQNPTAKLVPVPPFPGGDILQARRQCLTPDGRFPYAPELQIIKPPLRRILQMLSGDPSTKENYLDPWYDEEDRVYTVHEGSPSGVAGSFRTAGDAAGAATDSEQGPLDDVVDLRQGLLDAFKPTELENLSEIYLDVGDAASAITFKGEYREFSVKPLSRAQIQMAATGIPFHADLCRGSFPNELHRISQKLQRDVLDDEGKMGLAGLTIRVERAIYGLAERFQDILNSDDSVLFVGLPGAGKTAVLRDVCAYIAEGIHPRKLALVDSSQELGGADFVRHKCLGRTRWFGGLGWEGDLAELMSLIMRNHTPLVMATDEITARSEIDAARSIKESGLRMLATCHGSFQDLIKHPDKNTLLGGIASVTVTDEKAQKGGRFVKTMQSRAKSPIFDVIIEIHSKTQYVVLSKHRRGDCSDVVTVGEPPGAPAASVSSIDAAGAPGLWRNYW